MKQICTECDSEFDTNSPEKKRAGGKIFHCADCSEENAVKYLGLQSGDGKAAGLTILSFEDEQDREKYSSFWKNNSGMNKSKSCQLGNHLSTTPGVKFKKIHEAGHGMNHKGKAGQ
jgi:hypothetical protein